MRQHFQGNADEQRDFAARGGGGVNDFKEQPARFPQTAEEVIDTHKTPEPPLLRS